MRRYHPDGNPSADAAERVRAITTAYEVLGDEAKRREYDREWEPSRSSGPIDQRAQPRRAGPLIFGITLLCMGLLIWIIAAQRMVQSPNEGREPVTLTNVSRGPSNAPTGASCLTYETKSLVRAELLRRVGNLQGAGARLVSPDALSVRTYPALALSMPRPGLVECTAAITVLTPGTEAASDRQPALFGNVEFLIGTGSAQGVSLIELKPDDRFLIELASLQPTPVTNSENELPLQKQPSTMDPPPVRPASTTSRETPPKPVKVKVARNLSAKSGATGRPAEIAARVQVTSPAKTQRTISRQKEAPCAFGPAIRNEMCDVESLRPLEQQLAIFERQSATNADARKRDQLSQSRGRFEARQRSCATSACLRSAILARTTEIANIMNSGSSSVK